MTINICVTDIMGWSNLKNRIDTKEARKGT
jgi:hypothetical protein